MLRITGCAVIFLCCTSLGMIKSLTFRERRKELENTLELIRLLEMEISYRKETLYKAFERTSHLKECWMSDVFASCAGYLRKQDTLKDAWDSAMTLHMRSCPLGRTETDVIKRYIHGPGQERYRRTGKSLHSGDTASGEMSQRSAGTGTEAGTYVPGARRRSWYRGSCYYDLKRSSEFKWR